MQNNKGRVRSGALSQQVSARTASGESAGTAQGGAVDTAPLSLLPELDFPLPGTLVQVLSIFLLLTGTAEALLPVKP